MKKYRTVFIVAGVLLIIGLYMYKEYKDIKPKLELIKKLKQAPVPEIKFTPLNVMKDGDIIFHKSLSSQSEAIAQATHSEYTHCGIIYKIENDYFIYEAIEPVKLTPLIEWMGRGKGGAYTVKRLKNAEEVLTPATLLKLKKAGEKFKGKHYDSYFEWSDNRIYCSELIWKVYKEATGLEIGKLQKLSDFDLTSDVVKRKMAERYGNNIPLNEKVISPAAIFESDLLITIK